MDNIRKTIEILFKEATPEKVLNDFFSSQVNKKEYTEYISDDFEDRFTSAYPLYYTDDEAGEVKGLIEEKWMRKQDGFLENPDNKSSVFNVLTYFTREVLREVNGEPLCRYEHLLRWREVSFGINEDLLTTSFLANKDIESNRERIYFSWKPVVSSDNTRLKELFKKGVAENHYHLKGSAPHFDIAWIALMNNPLGYRKEFQDLKKESKRKAKKSLDFVPVLEDIELLVLKASYIRKLLFKKVVLKEEENDKEELNTNLLQAKNLDEFYLENENLKNENLKNENLKNENLKNENLKNENLKKDIEYLKYVYGKKFRKEIPDYAINSEMELDNQGYVWNILLSGERKLLYKMFKKIYAEDREIKGYEGLFYAYILIKQELREEVIQLNNRVGFKNFAIYQERKSNFIERGSIYERAIYNQAINATIEDQHIESLEARIAPFGTENIVNSIDKYAKETLFYKKDLVEYFEMYLKKEKGRNEKDILDKFFYTIHFIKESEGRDELREPNLILDKKARNLKTRRLAEKQAKEFNDLRKRESRAGSRVLGIDAANFEIGCRPEVFGQTFRFLKNYSYENPLAKYGIDNFKELGLTYHVGEDYLDLASGLRAIEEAIIFLELGQGDRLGHALALGINPWEYYEGKNGTVVLPKHDLLDNCAWLLAKIREFGIEDVTKVRHELLNKFNSLFSFIYGSRSVISEGNQKKGKLEKCPDTYYNAWKLRGDAPYYYKDGKFDKIWCYDFWERSGIRNNYELNEYRKDEEVLSLYYYYHFSGESKKSGGLATEFKVTKEYIGLIKKIQKKMQEEVRNKNLYIETNPSSNYLISTFKKYSKHPITNFFNLGLTYNEKELKECPQIPVSINTDDQGVFGTYLENEYALIARALEKEEDEEGNRRYNPSMIYEWLDKIRQHGLEQSFDRRRSNK